MRFEIYEGFEGAWAWYWRIRSSNGRIIADGSEAYSTKRGVVKAIHRLCAGILRLQHTPEIVEVES